MLAARWSEEFLEITFSARVAFSKRSWPYFLAMIIPWVVVQGQRCIARLRLLCSHRRSLSGYY